MLGAMMALRRTLAMPIAVAVAAVPVAIPLMPTFAAEAKAERRAGIAIGRIGRVGIVIRARPVGEAARRAVGRRRIAVRRGAGRLEGAAGKRRAYRDDETCRTDPHR